MIYISLAVVLVKSFYIFTYLAGVHDLLKLISAADYDVTVNFCSIASFESKPIQVLR